jgi:hypothetical protein
LSVTNVTRKAVEVELPIAEVAFAVRVLLEHARAHEVASERLDGWDRREHGLVGLPLLAWTRSASTTSMRGSRNTVPFRFFVTRPRIMDRPRPGGGRSRGVSGRKA